LRRGLRALAILFGLLFAITGPLRAQAGGAEAAHEQGRSIYNFRCYFCHGYSGDARTVASKLLDPPPRDFTALGASDPGRQGMIESVSKGRARTAMMSFSAILTPLEVAAVVDFVRAEFMRDRRLNTRYHTEANGWPRHERYRAAFPFATGEVPLDAAREALSPEQRAGRRLFLGVCVTCHDPGSADESGVPWEREALSFPRFGFQPGDFRLPPDAWSGASSFARHDLRPVIEGLDFLERKGEQLYQDNCAFCHAADGTGRNWIGRFMDPHPRDLTDPSAMSRMTRLQLARVIRGGIPGTSMPAWGSVLGDEQIAAIIEYVDAAFHPLQRGTGTDDGAEPESSNFGG